MSNFSFPILDGVAPSWADINVRSSVNGGVLLSMSDIAAIKTGSVVEVGEQQEGGRVIQRTHGSIKYTASWTLYAGGYMRLYRGLLASAPRVGGQAKVSLVPFTVSVIWTPFGSADIFEKRIKGCRLLSDEEDSAEGTDAAQTEMTLSPLQVVRVVDGVECVLL